MANFQEHILRKQAAASLASGNLAQAESTCRQILSRRKNDLTALQVMGVIAFERGRFADAASYLRKCLTQQPKDPLLHCNPAKAGAGPGWRLATVLGWLGEGWVVWRRWWRGGRST